MGMRGVVPAIMTNFSENPPPFSEAARDRARAGMTALSGGTLVERAQ
jgi:hypothetical protein